MNTDNTQLLNDLLVVAPVLVTETIYVKEPTPAEHTARLLAALLDKCKCAHCCIAGQDPCAADCDRV